MIRGQELSLAFCFPAAAFLVLLPFGLAAHCQTLLAGDFAASIASAARLTALDKPVSRCPRPSKVMLGGKVEHLEWVQSREGLSALFHHGFLQLSKGVPTLPHPFSTAPSVPDLIEVPHTCTSWTPGPCSISLLHHERPQMRHIHPTHMKLGWARLRFHATAPSCS